MFVVLVGQGAFPRIQRLYSYLARLEVLRIFGPAFGIVEMNKTSHAAILRVECRSNFVVRSESNISKIFIFDELVEVKKK